MSDWFRELFGFSERSAAQVRESVQVSGTRLTSKVNSKSYEFGRLDIDSLSELRRQVNLLKAPQGQLRVSELVGEALGNAQGQLWEMRNGYALPNNSGLSTVDEQLKAMSASEFDALGAKLKVGIQCEVKFARKAERLGGLFRQLWIVDQQFRS